MKKAICVFLFIALLFSFVSCQSTPDEAFVVKKDTERMVEQAGAQENGTPLDSLGIPDEHYIYNSIGANGKLRIEANAEIKTPEVETMPILRTSTGLFTQEQVTGIFNYLFPGEKPKYDLGQVETKTDLEQALLQMKRNLAEGNYEGGTEAQYKEKITAIEEAYTDAPDFAPEGNISDGMLTGWGTKADDTCRRLSVSNHDYALSIITHTGISGINGSQLPNLTYSCKDEKHGYSSRNMTATDGADLPDAAKEKLAISYEDAKLLCDGFFAAAGMRGQFHVGAAYLVDDTGPDGMPGENYAYRFHYTRQFSDIPLFFDVTNRLFGNDASYALPWPYEHIEFEVDNHGIVRIMWNSPITILDTVTRSATLKPFLEIIRLFEDISKATYEGAVMTTFSGEVKLDVTVSEIRLCLLRIREKNAEQTEGVLIPAWVFYGQNKATDIKSGEVRYLQGASVLTDSGAAGPMGEGGQKLSAFLAASGAGENELVALFAINGVDGSIIDLAKGY